MTETNVFQLCQPGIFADPLTEVLRNGARALLVQAVEAVVDQLVDVIGGRTWCTRRGARRACLRCRRRRDRFGHLPGRVTAIRPDANLQAQARQRSNGKGKWPTIRHPSDLSFRER